MPRANHFCEFYVYPFEKGNAYAYAARMHEGDSRKCGRPATVCSGGKYYCGRHDSELSQKDIAEIDSMAERQQSRRQNWAYGRAMPLNVSREKPKPPESESKPLKDQLTGKRLFLKDED